VDGSTFVGISSGRGSGDEPPEERPVTLKRRYLTSAVGHISLVFILFLYFPSVHHHL
jgi:hypothetical protein